MQLFPEGILPENQIIFMVRPSEWMYVRYDREIRREGHCYSERDQRGGGVPSRGGKGDIVTSTQDREKYLSVCQSTK